ncbi:outer membrane receptor for ferrienterochelin and colicins [Breznakibacter xylanolyticus]|uniref:Outer membrane receptor for ferrienterochelin and colicins n=1 Tax=Breznakibacter xylanolyticus TaxID=990 RepID=A0A2W7NHU6_9BACT|nr:TonB-dependent receptor [Breznakibacter xylanolyticus]PZX20011.1 outer membrane receptor for ferrienterochelin and colicins [Breznakibacter xylanolyticus]
MIKRCLTILLASLITISIMANPDSKPKSDAHVVGHVTSNGEHLPFVNIVVKNTNVGTTTDQTGHYSLSNAPTGKQVLKAHFVGYKPQEIEVDLKPNETTEIKFDLQEDRIGLNEVVVTANRGETNRQDAAVIVNVLNAKLFQATNAVCLSEGLSYQPGLRVENNCQNCGFQQVRINGLEGPYSQILIDSRPIYSALSGVYGIEQIPVNMIDRVEVIRGGGSALYGSNAIAGTINIITKEPLHNSFDVTENYALIDGTTDDNTIHFNSSYVSDNRQAGFSMFASNRKRGSYDANGDGFSELGKIEGSGLGFRSYYKMSPYSKITATYHYLNEFRRGGNQFDLQPHETDITEQTEHRINGGELVLDLFTPGYANKLSTYVSAQQTLRDSYYGAGHDPNAYGNTTDLALVAGSQYTHQFDKLWLAPATLTTGAEYQLNNLHDKMPGYQRDLKQDVNIAGFFLQNEWRFNHAQLLLGARLDKHNLIDDAIISPRANLLIHITPKLQWRNTFSTGFRAPQAFDEDLHIMAVGGEVMLIQLADDLSTERSYSYSTSFDSYYSLGNIENNFMVEGFYTKLTDVFKVEEIGVDDQGNKLLERRNASGAKVMGINLENRMIFSPKYQLQMGFTLQQSRYLSPEAWSDDTSAELLETMPRSPETYGYMSFTASPWNRFKTYLSGTYTGSMLVPHYAGYIDQDVIKHTPSFVDLNLKFSYDVKITDGVLARFETGVQNLFNSYQTDFDKGESRDAGYMYGPMKPRTIFVGIKISNIL